MLAAMKALYDTIGLDYANLRKSDARIAGAISKALGSGRTVLNVGAGSGSYEPADRLVTAVEPSAKMIRQRPASNATVVQGVAENLPFDDKSFDASMAVLTIHHWSDQQTGAAQMRRVTRDRIVFLTYDPSFRGFWLAEYFPGLVTLDEEKMPQLDRYEKWLGPVGISTVPIPHDCTDGFLAAYWRRPAAYLDERVRAAMSSFWALGDVSQGDVSQGLARLETDLNSGEWADRYSHLLDLDECDCGYRLVATR
jgi:SAM-dependent methyltransferase